MQPSIHYYVLSLSERTSRIYEGFRDKLIDIQDANFPFESSTDAESPSRTVSDNGQLLEFYRQTDQRFSRYCLQDPLRWVAAGQMSLLNKYNTLTAHMNTLIGIVEGDYTLTSRHDLGKIVWPVVKDAIAGTDKNAIHDLETAGKKKKVIFGIEAVGRSVETALRSILYVEEDYHVKGSIRKKDELLIVSKHVNLWEVIDDVVDLVIEKVLQMGGSVIFLKSGSLVTLDRIAMIQCD
jgi:hypothetical protein